ncbi:MAG: c-type cytochrome [Bacteroidia bacterium]|nr:c-type cytochrome [Bacteroidia bacterium]
MKPKISSVFLSAIFLFTISNKSIAQSSGEDAFKQTCAACHTVGGGKLVGPDLKNTNQRHSEEWLIKFIKSSQTVVKSGDKYADSIFNAFGKTIMPDQALDDSKIKDIIAYIADKSAGKTTASATSAVNPDAAATATTDGSKSTDSLYTTTNIILFGIIVFLMIVIIFLSRVIKKLSNQLMDFYSSDKSFY